MLLFDGLKNLRNKIIIYKFGLNINCTVKLMDYCLSKYFKLFAYLSTVKYACIRYNFLYSDSLLLRH